MSDRGRPSGRVFGLLEAMARGALAGAKARFRDLLAARHLFSWDILGSFRGLSGLLEAFRRGGLEVMSADPAGRPVASTLVMPDGDLVSRVSPDLLRQPELWQLHQQAVLQRLKPLTQVSALLASLSALLVLGSAGLGTYSIASLAAVAEGGGDALAARAVELWHQVRWPVLAGGLGGAGRFALKGWLRSKVEDLLSEE